MHQDNVNLRTTNYSLSGIYSFYLTVVRPELCMAHLFINGPAPRNSFSSLWPGMIGEGGVNEDVCLLGEVLPNFFPVLDLEIFSTILQFSRGLNCIFLNINKIGFSRC